MIAVVTRVIYPGDERKRIYILKSWEWSMRISFANASKSLGLRRDPPVCSRAQYLGNLPKRPKKPEKARKAPQSPSFGPALPYLTQREPCFVSEAVRLVWIIDGPDQAWSNDYRITPANQMWTQRILGRNNRNAALGEGNSVGVIAGVAT